MPAKQSDITTRQYKCLPDLYMKCNTKMSVGNVPYGLKFYPEYIW